MKPGSWETMGCMEWDGHENQEMLGIYQILRTSCEVGSHAGSKMAQLPTMLLAITFAVLR